MEKNFQRMGGELGELQKGRLTSIKQLNRMKTENKLLDKVIRGSLWNSVKKVMQSERDGRHCKKFYKYRLHFEKFGCKEQKGENRSLRRQKTVGKVIQNERVEYNCKLKRKDEKKKRKDGREEGMEGTGKVKITESKDRSYLESSNFPPIFFLLVFG